MILAWILSLQLLGQPSDSFDYGEVYYAETQDRLAPKLHLGIGYAFNISNSFLDLNGVVGNLQTRVWKYFSAGLVGLINTSELSSAGDEIRRLETVDIRVKIPVPRWGIFAASSGQIMLGRWNLMNLFPLESEIVLEGGLGFINRGQDTNGPQEYQASYLWSMEHRVHVSRAIGIFISVLGHRDTAYLQSGLSYRFD
jgi:hypothetical protein